MQIAWLFLTAFTSNPTIMHEFLRKGPQYLLSLSLFTLWSGQLLAMPGLKTVPVDFWTANFTLSNGTVTGSGATPWTTVYTGPGQAAQRFAVYNNEFRVNNITVNGTGAWTSGSINIAGKTQVKISVDLRSGVTGNGSLDNDNSDHYDYICLYYKIDNGAEQLVWQKRGAINSNSATSTTVTKDSLSGSTLRIIIRARATATDEFYFFDNVKVAGVDQVPVDADAAVSGTLTCTNTSVLLSGSSAAPGVSYNWAGPGGFSAIGQQVSTSVPGLYTLTVTGVGGATATKMITVLQNTATPAITAFATDQLTCFNTSVTIIGNSGTPGVTYSWTGPGNFSATTPSSAVTASGEYTLKVTNPANGCFHNITVNVGENKIPPANVTVVASGTLTCFETLVVITGSSSTPDADYFWTGPDNFSSSSPEEFISTPGAYVLTVTNLVNGCVAADTVTVTQDLSECERSASRSTKSSARAEAGVAAVAPPVVEGKLYPNPVKRNFFVSFRAPVSGAVQASLYNNNGVPVKQLFNGQVTAGELFNKEAGRGDLPAGIYYCIIRINDKIYVRNPILLQ
jgi:hypothetical protein